jgi:hypothetical protein
MKQQQQHNAGKCSKLNLEVWAVRITVGSREEVSGRKGVCKQISSTNNNIIITVIIPCFVGSLTVFDRSQELRPPAWHWIFLTNALSHLSHETIHMCYDELAAAVALVYDIKCGGALNMCRAASAEWRSALPLVAVCTGIKMGAVLLYSRPHKGMLQEGVKTVTSDKHRIAFCQIVTSVTIFI